jgi:hypothetical protein
MDNGQNIDAPIEVHNRVIEWNQVIDKLRKNNKTLLVFDWYYMSYNTRNYLL